MPRKRSLIVTILGVILLSYWSFMRWFYVAGGPWQPGHTCSSLVACLDGLCLVHSRGADGALGTAPGYCSKRCESDAQCPADMACEKLPAGMSRSAGDHLPLIKLPDRLCVRGPRGAPDAKR